MLSTSLVQANLKRIGRHPITLQHVLLELALSNKNLENINSISTFPHVMYLDLSTNNIETISILSELPTLVELNARLETLYHSTQFFILYSHRLLYEHSRNKITECLDFGAPLCSFEQSWETGHNAAGSLLTNVDLSENSIQRLRDLSHHQFLEKLILHHNGISAIDGLHGLKYLRVLDLSYNNISVIEGLDNLPITELRLKGNKIQQLNGLDKLPHLSVLDVSENKIISLSQLALCTNLVHLDVSHNRIEYIRQCEYLQQVQWLTTLVLDNNPCERKELYRLRVLFRLPNLLMLDNSEASLEDKVGTSAPGISDFQCVIIQCIPLCQLGPRVQPVPLSRGRSGPARGRAAPVSAPSRVRGPQPAAAAAGRRGAAVRRGAAARSAGRRDACTRSGASRDAAGGGGVSPRRGQSGDLGGRRRISDHHAFTSWE